MSGALPARWSNIEKWVWAPIRAIDIPRIFRSRKGRHGPTSLVDRGCTQTERDIAPATFLQDQAQDDGVRLHVILSILIALSFSMPWRGQKNRHYTIRLWFLCQDTKRRKPGGPFNLEGRQFYLSMDSTARVWARGKVLTKYFLSSRGQEGWTCSFMGTIAG